MSKIYDDNSGRCVCCGADTLWGNAPHESDCEYARHVHEAYQAGIAFAQEVLIRVEADKAGLNMAMVRGNVGVREVASTLGIELE